MATRVNQKSKNFWICRFFQVQRRKLWVSQLLSCHSPWTCLSEQAPVRACGPYDFSKQQLWERFRKYYTEFPTAGLALDLSRTGISDEFVAEMEPRMQVALAEMTALEAGAIANRDEGRMVGHYWLRNPSLAPSPDIRREIEETLAQVKSFTADVHAGVIRGVNGNFKNLLLIGIGGSALGPQFVANALGDPREDKMRPFFFDNTDPDGMQRVLASIGQELGRTLCLVISKSGGTKETHNGMLTAKWAYEEAGHDFARHAVAVTGKGSELNSYAVRNKWIETFPMWDWVGGRTSELSAVGLLPAALQGFDIESLLAGAKACDELTRSNVTSENPGAMLALAWFNAVNGKGEKNMVVIPYKDRLELLSRYLQQLIMESLGKEQNRDGNIVNQGLSVFGNKGSTDQHSYIQQLRDGMNDFLVTFVEVLKDGESVPVFVETKVTSGDYLHGFYLGTRQALTEGERHNITLTIRDTSAFSVGVLIALFERAVGLYATLININAYHQPGVEAGKIAAAGVIALQSRILKHLHDTGSTPCTALEIAIAIGDEEDVEHVFKICEHLAANPSRSIMKLAAPDCFESRYYMA
jgi:glucose-6-phosphate isomerase